MGWNHELANKIKGQSASAREKAVNDASAYVAIVKQVKPMVVTIAGGELIYEEKEKEIIMSEAIREMCDASPPTLKVGDKLLAVPVDGINTMAVIYRLG